MQEKQGFWEQLRETFPPGRMFIAVPFVIGVIWILDRIGWDHTMSGLMAGDFDSWVQVVILCVVAVPVSRIWWP